MIDESTYALEHRVLVVAPTFRDGEVTRALLTKAGLVAVLSPNLRHLCLEARAGAAAILLTSQVLSDPEIRALAAQLELQPPWSDLPIVLLMQGGTQSGWDGLLNALGNVTLLDKPSPARSVLSAVRTAVRARHRQYQVRDHLAALAIAESALRGSQQQLELVVKGASVGIWQCALPLDKLCWDETTKEHFFLSPEAEVSIETFFSRLHPEDRDTTQAAIDRSIAAREPFEIEYRTLDPTGDRVKWIRALGRAVYDDTGAAIQFNGITFDITRRKLAEQE
jgi:PAS domain-containing protein